MSFHILKADLFVTYERLYETEQPYSCNRLKYVDEAIENGATIQKVTFEEFLEMLGTTNEELESLPLPPIDCLFREDAIIKNKK